jgi:thiol-disulfide isomerase/thioredoxin
MHLTRAVSLTALVIFLCSFASAQTKRTAKKPVVTGPTVTRIDIEGLKKLLKPNGKPLLINFWATWCDPCREEFPDLVKIDLAYKGKIDFVTVSLDDLADIKTVVPKFLRDMKAEMPAYLLSTPDENEAITLVSKNWAGNLPLTVLFYKDGTTAFEKNGKVRHDVLTSEIDKVLKSVQ